MTHILKNNPLANSILANFKSMGLSIGLFLLSASAIPIVAQANPIQLYNGVQHNFNFDNGTTHEFTIWVPENANNTMVLVDASSGSFSTSITAVNDGDDPINYDCAYINFPAQNSLAANWENYTFCNRCFGWGQFTVTVTGSTDGGSAWIALVWDPEVPLSNGEIFPDVEIVDGQPTTEFDFVADRNWFRFTVDVPEGASDLSFQLSSTLPGDEENDASLAYRRDATAQWYLNDGYSNTDNTNDELIDVGLGDGTYSVIVYSNNNEGASNLLVTANWTEATLILEDEVLNLSGDEHTKQYFQFYVPEGSTNLVVRLQEGPNAAGDADLYVTNDLTEPYIYGHEFEDSISHSSNEIAEHLTGHGMYFAEVFAYTAFSDVDLFFSYDYPTLENGSVVTLSGAGDSTHYYRVTVPEGASNIDFRLSNGPNHTGDADLYIGYEFAPDEFDSHDCGSFTSTDHNEFCGGFSEPGTYYILVHGYDDPFTDAILEVSWDESSLPEEGKLYHIQNTNVGFNKNRLKFVGNQNIDVVATSDSSNRTKWKFVHVAGEADNVFHIVTNHNNRKLRDGNGGNNAGSGTGTGDRMRWVIEETSPGSGEYFITSKGNNNQPRIRVDGSNDPDMHSANSSGDYTKWEIVEAN